VLAGIEEIVDYALAQPGFAQADDLGCGQAVGVSAASQVGED
jgi:hypothetical protein